MPGKNHFRQNWLARQTAALRRGQNKLGEKVGKTNTKLTKPVVKLFRGITNTLGEFGRSFTGFFGAITRTLLRPFRVLSAKTSQKSSEIEKKLSEAKVKGIKRFKNIGIVSWFFDTVRSLINGVGSTWTLIKTKIYKSPLLKALLFPVIILGRATVYTYEFLSAWFRTRRFMRLIATIPAIILIVPVAYYSVRIPFYSNAAKASTYRKAIFAAIQEQDLETAQFLSRKIKQLGEDSPRQLFEKVIIAWQADDVDETLRLLEELSPDDGSGYPAAYAFKAERIMDRTITFDDTEELNAALESCLKIANQAFPDDGLTGHWLAALYAGTEREKEALAVLDGIDISKQTPAMMVPIATMYHSWGNPRKARQIASEASRAYGRVNIDLLKANDFLYWSTARKMSNDIDGSLDILLQGYGTIKERDPLHGLTDKEIANLSEEKREELQVEREQGLERILTQSIKFGLSALENARRTNQTDRWLSLAKLILDSPNAHHDLQIRVVYGIEDSNADRVEALLKPYLASGTLTLMAQIHYAQIKFSQGKINEAKAAYELVHKHHPENLDVANNLAWMYSHFEPFDVDRALELANHVVAAKPNHAAFRETRGQVFVQLERWEEAISDLEFALNGLEQSDENAEIHNSLAKCYTQVGNERLASMHRNRFRSLQVSN